MPSKNRRLDAPVELGGPLPTWLQRLQIVSVAVPVVTAMVLALHTDYLCPADTLFSTLTVYHVLMALLFGLIPVFFALLCFWKCNFMFVVAVPAGRSALAARMAPTASTRRSIAGLAPWLFAVSAICEIAVLYHLSFYGYVGQEKIGIHNRGFRAAQIYTWSDVTQIIESCDRRESNHRDPGYKFDIHLNDGASLATLGDDADVSRTSAFLKQIQQERQFSKIDYRYENLNPSVCPGSFSFEAGHSL